MKNIETIIDKDAEKAVLGALLIDKSIIPEIQSILGISTDVFYTTDHKLIYSAILTVFNDTNQIDPLLVANELRSQDQLNRVGGPEYLYELQSPIVETENTHLYAEILVEKCTRRQLIQVSKEIFNYAIDESKDLDTSFLELQECIYNLGKTDEDDGYIDLAASLRQNTIDIENAEDSDGITGLRTGFIDFDELTGGLQPGQLIIIAARTSMGKTSFVLNIAANVAINYQKPVVFFTLEMPVNNLTMRILSSETGIEFNRLRNYKFPYDKWESIATRISEIGNAPLKFKYIPGMTCQGLRTETRKLKIENPDLSLIVVDYMQKMRAQHSKIREQEISEISRTLSEIAGELNLPIITCSQLNREIESRNNKLPKLSDLRESGAIEQDADIVAFLHREDYYEDDENLDEKVEASLLIKKHRNGRLGTIMLNFNRQLMHFESVLM